MRGKADSGEEEVPGIPRGNQCDGRLHSLGAQNREETHRTKCSRLRKDCAQKPLFSSQSPSSPCSRHDCGPKGRQTLTPTRLAGRRIEKKGRVSRIKLLTKSSSQKKEQQPCFPPDSPANVQSSCPRLPSDAKGETRGSCIISGGTHILIQAFESISVTREDRLIRRRM